MVLLLLLNFLAGRYFSSFVACNIDGETGAMAAIWTLRVCACLVAIAPILLGLVVLGHRQWNVGAISIAIGIAILLIMEGLPRIRRRKIHLETQKHATAFHQALTEWAPEAQTITDQEVSRDRRRSNATIFELLASLHPEPNTSISSDLPLPLPSDAIDDLVSPHVAAWANPLAERPPILPPIEGAESSLNANASKTMYPPSLLAPPPIIWLPDDKNGIGRLEASDLIRYHQLDVMVDVVKT